MDAVLVESEATLGQVLPTEAVRALDDAVTGRAVLTASGERIGAISGIWVTTADGRIAAYRVHPEAGLLSRLARLIRSDVSRLRQCDDQSRNRQHESDNRAGDAHFKQRRDVSTIVCFRERAAPLLTGNSR